MEQKSKEESGAKKEEQAVAPWRPFAEWPFQRRFLRSLDDDLFPWPWGARGEAVLPAMDVRENDRHYAVTVELPGVRKDDVHVECDQGLLTIRGRRRASARRRRSIAATRSAATGSFSRSFRLPSDADVDRLEASFKDGVLSPTISRTEQTKPRAIAIKS